MIMKPGQEGVVARVVKSGIDSLPWCVSFAGCGFFYSDSPEEPQKLADGINSGLSPLLTELEALRALEKVAWEMTCCLAEIAASGVSFEDSRLDYKEMQISEDVLDASKKALAAYAKWKSALLGGEGK